MDVKASFEVVHGLADKLMAHMDVCVGSEYTIEPVRGEGEGPFLDGRSGKILFRGQEIGCLGVIHPDVLERFELPYPISIVEFSLEPMLYRASG